MKDLEAPAPVHGAIRLAEVQEHAIEGALLYEGELLQQLRLHYVCAAPHLFSEAMEGVMKHLCVNMLLI